MEDAIMTKVEKLDEIDKHLLLVSIDMHDLLNVHLQTLNIPE
jgi:hypothetical protein